jgi:hypothetical protein
VELKEAFVRKSDLLDMDRPVKQIPREDATSRLFSAARSPESARKQPESAPAPVQESREESAPSGKKRRRKKGQKGTAPKSAPKAPEQPKSAQKGAQSQQKAQKPQQKGCKKPPKQEEKRVVFTVAKEGKKQRRDRARTTFSEAQSGAHQKDSTEQKSLMKPYYLSDRRKG